MKVKAKCGLIYQGMVYKAGEVFEVKDIVGYAFSWLVKNRWVEILDGDIPANDKPEPQDDLRASTDGLPPLEEPAPVKKGKKNV